MNRTSLVSLFAAAALLPAATARAGITANTTFTDHLNHTVSWIWTLTVTDPDAISSLHITGKKIGESLWIEPNFEGHPDGWQWTGTKDQGDYSWVRTDKTNQSGTLKFNIRLAVNRSDREAAGKVEVDYYKPGDTTPTWVTVSPPSKPDVTNWIYTPVPAPQAPACLLAAAALFARRRPR